MLGVLSAEIVVLTVTGIALHFVYRPSASQAWNGLRFSDSGVSGVPHWARVAHQVTAGLTPGGAAVEALRETGGVESGAVYELPVRPRYLAVDERGTGFRATWHPDRGFVNLSLWRDDTCAETFHLTPAEASRLVGFLVDGLADAAAASPGTHRKGSDGSPERSTVAEPSPTPAGIRRSLSNALDRIADQIRQQ